MARNQVQFQKGISLPEFLKQYGTQEQCHTALFNWRWPDDFNCPECGVSALSLKRQLGIGYNAAWRMKHKLLQVMKERDDSKLLSGHVQMDDVYWGGEKHGEKRGRGAAGIYLVIWQNFVTGLIVVSVWKI
ncbi:MAG: hypothetical protein ACI8XC_003040 [Gammaproteobacteria bacterium]|jgi:hypothetical protein